VLSQAQSTVTVAEISRLYTADDTEQDLLRRASEAAALPDSWREYFRNRLWKPDS
jgi:MOSC domain-containing protein YiiM